MIQSSSGVSIPPTLLNGFPRSVIDNSRRTVMGDVAFQFEFVLGGLKHGAQSSRIKRLPSLVLEDPVEKNFTVVVVENE